MSGRVHAEAQATPKSSFVPVRAGLLAGSRGEQLVSQPPLVQAKLTINQPNDRYEQEADRVADEVMRMPEPQVQRQLEEEEMLSMKENEEGATIIKYNDFRQNLQSSEPMRPSGPRIQMKKYVRQLPYKESVEAVKPDNFEKLGTIVSMGTKGPSSTVPYKGEMEQAFGVDFSNVMIYTGSDPKEASESLGAEAFTVGNKIAFKEANPDRATVAHELTHVVQQGGTPSVQMSSMTSKSDSSEKEASAVEDAFTSGKELPEISTQLSATTVAGVWGEVRQMGEEGVWVRYDPEHGQVEITGDNADSYLLINQPGLSSGIIPVSQLNDIVRADIEAALELPLSELPQSIEETAREAATSPPGSRRMPELPPRAEPAVRPGMPEHLRPGVELFREGLQQTWPGGRGPTSTSAVPLSIQRNLTPPGNCTRVQHRILYNTYKAVCDSPDWWRRSRGRWRECLPGDRCNILLLKMQRSQLCARHRRAMNEICYRGGDENHRRAEREARRAQARCMGFYRANPRCHQRRRRRHERQPERRRVRAPRRTTQRFDQSFLDEMSALTGLTGAALITYLLISEGTRLFPARNLVPVL